jgi:hypothetical protein
MELDLAGSPENRPGERLQTLTPKMGCGENGPATSAASAPFAWLLNARRLNKDYEKTRKNRQSMVYLAMISIMLNRL